jgi:hypothetical protein
LRWHTTRSARRGAIYFKGVRRESAIASASRGSSEWCSASDAGRSPRGSCRRLCHQTRIPGAACSGDVARREPATNSARAGWTLSLSKGKVVWPWLVRPRLRRLRPCRSGRRREKLRVARALQQLVTTPILSLSRKRLRTSGTSGHGPSSSPIPRSRSGAASVAGRRAAPLSDRLHVRAVPSGGVSQAAALLPPSRAHCRTAGDLTPQPL